jgi:hypothetical protein
MSLQVGTLRRFLPFLNLALISRSQSFRSTTGLNKLTFMNGIPGTESKSQGARSGTCPRWTVVPNQSSTARFVVSSVTTVFDHWQSPQTIQSGWLTSDLGTVSLLKQLLQGWFRIRAHCFAVGTRALVFCWGIPFTTQRRNDSCISKCSLHDLAKNIPKHHRFRASKFLACLWFPRFSKNY